ncbi:MAG: hypothetical protein IJU84_08750 [Clostridia bacterium]|nr:hypothetical protein [Clostridia bacterium]
MSSCSTENEVNATKPPEGVPDGYVAEGENGLMFDEPEGARIYNYCPSIIVDGDDAYVWYCSSVIENIGGDDHIAYRKGKRVGGVWYWSPREIILGYERNTYYSGNICDPEVIKGEFAYRGETYNYLMAVLGCKTKDNSANMFGFKISKTVDGPWIDVPEISPLYDFYKYYPDYRYNGSNFVWGWGQCSLVSLDKKGKVLLFYTGRSGTGQKLEMWDFSDLENPKGIYETEVRNSGVFDLNGNDKDSICNAQFMYDESKDRFYMVCNTHPYSEIEWPTNVPYKSKVYYLDNPTGKELGYVFQYKKLKWNELFTLEESTTGYQRNHNCCFFRDAYGWKPDGNIEVAYTMSETGVDWKVLFSYRIHRYVFGAE